MPIPIFDASFNLNLNNINNNKSSNKNNSSLSDNNLNINGKKFYRNREKTIWSYSPNDTSFRVGSLIQIFLLLVNQNLILFVNAAKVKNKFSR